MVITSDPLYQLSHASNCFKIIILCMCRVPAHNPTILHSIPSTTTQNSITIVNGTATHHHEYLIIPASFKINCAIAPTETMQVISDSIGKPGMVTPIYSLQNTVSLMVNRVSDTVTVSASGHPQFLVWCTGPASRTCSVDELNRLALVPLRLSISDRQNRNRPHRHSKPHSSIHRAHYRVLTSL